MVTPEKQQDLVEPEGNSEHELEESFTRLQSDISHQKSQSQDRIARCWLFQNNTVFLPQCSS